MFRKWEITYCAWYRYIINSDLILQSPIQVMPVYPQIPYEILAKHLFYQELCSANHTTFCVIIYSPTWTAVPENIILLFYSWSINDHHGACDLYVLSNHLAGEQVDDGPTLQEHFSMSRVFWVLAYVQTVHRLGGHHSIPREGGGAFLK